MMLTKKILIVAMTMLAVSCTRSTQSTDTTPAPVQKSSGGTKPNSTEQNPAVGTDLEQSNASTTNNDVVEPEMPALCRDSSGTEIANQYQDQTKNANPSNVVDCYDDQGKILFKGTAKNCLEELQTRFGPDIIFPSQQLFPKLYESARVKGAEAQTALKQALSANTCAELKAKE